MQDLLRQSYEEWKSVNGKSDRESKNLDRAEQALQSKRRLPFAFEGQQTLGQRVLVVRQGVCMDPVWMVGDLHGDLLALEAILLYIEQQSARQLIFLGDLVDDGPDAYPLFHRILDWVFEKPNTVALLAGNHDAALSCDGDRFHSAVSPSEFSDWLNNEGHNKNGKRTGQLFQRVFEAAPRAIFFENDLNGLLVAHGGVPHTDLHEKIKKPDDLELIDDCQQDFMWTRAHPRAPHKESNRRNNRGHQFGSRDFSQFCEVASRVLGFEVFHMVRGHDHLDGDDGYLVLRNYAPHTVVTINAFSHRLNREICGPYVRRPCVIRYKAGEKLQIHLLQIDDLVRKLYPEPAD